MKTLVIHPKDTSTDFLAAIYSDKPDWAIINFDCSSAFLKQQIFNHERIIIMGHGTPMGLLGYGKFVITPEFVYLLKEPNKKYVFIWCNADMFVERYDLHGFYTGMIISEYEEALMFSIKPNINQIEYSNWLFAESIKNAIDTDSFHQRVLVDYDNYVNENPIINFNKENIYER